MNQIIIEVLEVLIKIFRNDRYRRRAYENAIKNIENSDVEITSGKQARKEIPGIGKSIAEKIDEIIKTGTLEIIEKEEEKIEKDIVCRVFEGIHGVGVKTSEKWYDMGYRTLTDLKAEWKNMTAAQRLGYKYYHHINQRIPRNELDVISNKLSQLMKCEFMICGSYRRGCGDSGDVDVLVKWEPGLSINVLLDRLKDILVGDLSIGDKKYMGICKLGQEYNARRLDMLIVKPEEWPFATLYFTGSKKLNVMMRQRAIDMNMSLSEYSLTGFEGKIEEEEDIFKALNMRYLSPEERCL